MWHNLYISRSVNIFQRGKILYSAFEYSQFPVDLCMCVQSDAI